MNFINVNTSRNRAYDVGLFGRVARKKLLVNYVKQGEVVEVHERYAEQTSWILGNSNLVRRTKVQSFRVRRKSNGVANA